MSAIDKALHQLLANAILNAQAGQRSAATAAEEAARAFRAGLAEFTGPQTCASVTGSNADPQIGDEFEGGIYAGLSEVDGKPARLILLPGEAKDVSWDEAMKWAQLQSGELPTRAEHRHLYDILKAEFEPRWHWSCEQLADYPAGAWTQGFVSGGQVNTLKSYAGAARAVRRLPI